MSGSNSDSARKGDEIRLPRSGSVLVLAVSVVAISIDLANAGAPATESAGFAGNLPNAGGRSEANSQTGGGGAAAPSALQPQGYAGHWIDIFADAADLGIISGPTLASVTGGNVPALATVGNAGTAGTCMRLASGSKTPYWVTPDDRFLGVVGAGNGFIRIALRSR